MQKCNFFNDKVAMLMTNQLLKNGYRAIKRSGIILSQNKTSSPQRFLRRVGPIFFIKSLGPTVGQAHWVLQSRLAS